MNNNVSSAGSATAITGTDTSVTYNSTTSKIGHAGQFNGTSSKIAFNRTAIPASNSPYTVSAWARQTAQQNNNREVIAQWSFSTSGNAYFMGTSANTTVRIADQLTATSTWTAATWHHMVSLNVSDNHYYYQDGVLKATKGSAFTQTGTDLLYLGVQGNLNGEFWNGAIDEVRIRLTAVSANWITAEYNNQNSYSTFYSVAAVGGGSAAQAARRGVIMMM